MICRLLVSVAFLAVGHYIGKEVGGPSVAKDGFEQPLAEADDVDTQVPASSENADC